MLVHINIIINGQYIIKSRFKIKINKKADSIHGSNINSTVYDWKTPQKKTITSKVRIHTNEILINKCVNMLSRKN